MSKLGRGVVMGGWDWEWETVGWEVEREVRCGSGVMSWAVGMVGGVRWEMGWRYEMEVRERCCKCRWG